VLVLNVTLTRGPAILGQGAGQNPGNQQFRDFDQVIDNNAATFVAEGQRIFRHDTFGDEAFWGDTLQLHKAIEGARFGGVGPGISPKAALALGLKVDVDALPHEIVGALRSNRVDLNDPATTLTLLRANAVVGITGFFNSDGS